METASFSRGAETHGDLGLLYGFHAHSPNEDARELEAADVAEAIRLGTGVVWLHFNLSSSRARSLISQATFVPPEVRDVLVAHETRRRVEFAGGGLLAVLSDLTFEHGSDPDEVAGLWCFAAPGLFVTGRTHPLQTPDRLRAALRTGLRASSGYDLLLWLLNQRTNTLRDLTADMSEQVSEIEQEILEGRIREQRELLGRIRRFCAQLRRHFGPDRTAFRRLLQQPQVPLGSEVVEGVRFEIEELSFLMEDVLELYERSKLLQEELASRVAENTGRSLYVLAILSAVFLPMTLITGIFGMNVAGLPGLSESSAFWRVMLLIVAAGVMTLTLIVRRDRG